MRALTERQLQHFDGTRGRPIYIALKGVIYDVSEAPQYYGPGAPYHVFAGRECSRALALVKVARSECNDQLADLGDEELNTLEGWVCKFTSKYPIVGQVHKQAKRSIIKFLPFFSGTLLLITIIARKICCL